MLAFLFGVLAGGISGYLTYGSTAQMGLAVGVGIVVFLIGWLLGARIALAPMCRRLSMS